MERINQWYYLHISRNKPHVMLTTILGCAMPDSVTVNRKVLYQRVWSEPVTKLAREFGLSDVGFAKLCKRNEIPRPPRGFWARKAAGQKPLKVPMPRPDATWDIKITAHEKDIQDPGLREEAKKELSQTVPEVPIEVPESLRGAHPLVSHSLHVLESGKPDEDGIIHPPIAGCLDVSVSKTSLRRALRIMEAIITTFEARGYQVKAQGEPNSSGTFVELMETRVSFGMREVLVEKKEEADDSPDLQGPYVFRHSRFKAKTVPSGDLCLEIDPQRYRYYRQGDGQRRKWSDGQRGQIEGFLNLFVAGVVKIAIGQREVALASEKRERERCEQEKLAAEQEAVRVAMWARIQAERAKVDKLLSDADAWERSRQLRAYIEFVRTDAVARGKDVHADSETGKWLQWALEQADRLNPLKESPRSILDDEAKYKPPERPRFW